VSKFRQFLGRGKSDSPRIASLQDSRAACLGRQWQFFVAHDDGGYGIDIAPREAIRILIPTIVRRSEPGQVMSRLLKEYVSAASNVDIGADELQVSPAFEAYIQLWENVGTYLATH
jgi:hypothetical protein